MKKKTPIKPMLYEVCVNGCMLFLESDKTTTQCNNRECNEPRYHNGVARRYMKMLPIGLQIAAMLANPSTRELMLYRSQYYSQANVYEDYFDGDSYKKLKQQGLFTGDHDVALAMFVDGFTSTKTSQSSKLNIVHLINLNLPPHIRYQDNYTFQVAVLPGPNNPKALLDTFLRPIIGELKTLASSGMAVLVKGEEVCRAKVHLVMATGDLPASTDLAHHMTFSAKYGCRICETTTTREGYHTCFLADPSHLTIRSKAQFVAPSTENNLGIRSSPIFCNLLSFSGPAFFGLDEMHLLGHGLGKTMYDLITISLGKSYNSSSKLVPGNPAMSPFYIDKKDLVKIGRLIEASKVNVPVSFNSKWVDPIKNSGGNRAVDYINFLLYQLPAYFVSYLSNKTTQETVINLVKACQLCMKWSISSEDLKVIKTNFESWVRFLKLQVEKKNLSPGVLKPTQHYLLHIEYIIKQNGPLRAFSARSMERAIGKYKKLLKSKSSVGENAGNVLIRLANRSYIANLPWSVAEASNLMSARPYSGTTFKNHPLDSSQLWEPFFEYSITRLPYGIGAREMAQALQRFCTRVVPNAPTFDFSTTSLCVAGRAWGFGKTHFSQLYADYTNERRRGNSFVMIYITHKK